MTPREAVREVDNLDLDKIAYALAPHLSGISDPAVLPLDPIALPDLLAHGAKLGGRWTIVDMPVPFALRAKEQWWEVTLHLPWDKLHQGEDTTTRAETLQLAVAKALLKGIALKKISEPVENTPVVA